MILFVLEKHKMGNENREESQREHLHRVYDRIIRIENKFYSAGDRNRPRRKLNKDISVGDLKKVLDGLLEDISLLTSDNCFNLDATGRECDYLQKMLEDR